MTRLVKLTDVLLEGETQMRARIDTQVVAEYAERMGAGDQFPPVDLFSGDGLPLLVGDGFHRCRAALKAGLDEVLATVHPGGRREAMQHAFGANGRHGLRRTNEDKRRAVRTALAEEEWSTWSDRRLAELCCVSHRTVAAVRAELQSTGQLVQSSTRTTADGRTMNVVGISTANAGRGLAAETDASTVLEVTTASNDTIMGTLREITELVDTLRARVKEQRDRLRGLVPTSAWHSEAVVRQRGETAEQIDALVIEVRRLKARIG